MKPSIGARLGLLIGQLLVAGFNYFIAYQATHNAWYTIIIGSGLCQLDIIVQKLQKLSK